VLAYYLFELDNAGFNSEKAREFADKMYFEFPYFLFTFKIDGQSYKNGINLVYAKIIFQK